MDSSHGAVKPRALIEASWRRCRDYGLDPMTSPAEAFDIGFEMDEQQRLLVETTSREVLPDHARIVANSQSLIVLADHQGRVLERWGDLRFLPPQGQALFRTGASWQEQTGGTNAIGTALHTGQALQVFREEHFLQANRFMIGSAAPILAADRRLVGILSVTSDSFLPQTHTLGMVKLMSQTIENRLILASHADNAFVLTFNTNLDNIDSQWSGIIAFDDGGIVLAANRRAEMLAGCDLPGVDIEAVFGTPGATLIADNADGARAMRIKGRQTIYGVLQRPRPRSHVAPPDSAERIPGPGDTITFDRLTFGDSRIERAIRQAQCVVEKDIPILVYGETGVGKEVFVRALHQQSSRSSKPLVAINCAAIPNDLVESELFGYERGAFTGASSKGATGLIRKAHQGTLFLDEIGEMPMRAQARLLRVLQERTVTPLGSTESYPVDIKLVTATNRNLRSLVQDGGFRQDLFYRINGLGIELPPLRQRADKHALFEYLHRLYGDNDNRHPLSDDMQELFARHPWPGNIRQLINVLQVGLAIAGEQPLERWHLPDDFFEDIGHGQPPGDSPGTGRAHAAPPAIETDEVRPAGGLSALYQRHRGNVSRIARDLGLSRNTVYKRLKAQGLRP
jgi:sigma-54 dependent transcriptional regulator, acetoin dehydrogenase operon transcriptional activator AcoR